MTLKLISQDESLDGFNLANDSSLAKFAKLSRYIVFLFGDNGCFTLLCYPQAPSPDTQAE